MLILLRWLFLRTESDCNCSRWFRAKHGIHHANCSMYDDLIHEDGRLTALRRR